MTVHVFNARTLAVSTYTPAPLDVVAHEGEVYFVTATGLEKLDAAANMDAVSYIRTGKISPASGRVTGARFAHLSTSASGPTELRTYRDDLGVERMDRYPTPVVPDGQAREHTVVLGKGAQASAWGFEFRAVAATTRWSLGGMEIDVPLQKHRL
jgi:hypothetical protein